METLKDSIQLQKERAPELKDTLDFYKIRDPIMHKYAYQILYKYINLA